jgi:uncharacterized protein (TIGR03118 family)
MVAVTLMVLACVAAPASADQPFYTQTNLVSNNGVPGTFPDTNLVNAWGIVQPPGGPFWVNTNGTGFSELFDGTGTPLAALPRVTIPPAGASTPTGIVFNSAVGTPSSNFGADLFIFATEDGTISGWQLADGGAAMPRVPAADAAVYKGLAFGFAGSGAPMIYATNFHAGRIDVFDGNYATVSLAPGDFSDPALPAHYAPFGIANIGGHLFVSYALQDADMHDDVKGPHHGFVDEFTTDGVMVRRFASRGRLNSPWGIALAPSDFGRFSGRLLIGNFGNGHINAFALKDGKWIGELHGPRGPIAIDGLWGLAFGNGSTTFKTPANTLFFAAGPNDESNGLFGKLEVRRDKDKGKHHDDR